MKKIYLLFALSIAVVAPIFSQIYIDTDNFDATPPVTTPAVTTPTITTPTVISTPAVTTPTVITPTVISAPAVTTPKVTTTPPVITTPRVVTQPVMTPPPAYTGNLTAANDELPPFAEPGKCYARCFIPDQFEFVERDVIDRPATYKTQVMPAVFSTVYDTVIVVPARTKMEVVPAQYETVYEEVMVAPATQRWEKGKGDANCLSADPKDCQVMCLVDVPAQYKKVERKVLKTPSFTRENYIPAETKIVPRQVMTQPAQTLNIEVPATYKKVMEKQLSKRGGYTDWRQVLCGNQLTNERIRAIQNALRAKGYNVGPSGADNIFGEDTKKALIKYQQDNRLPQGNLNMETLKSLGVE